MHSAFQCGIQAGCHDARGGKTSRLIMKQKLPLLCLAALALILPSCVSAGLQFRDSFTGRVTTKERIVAAAVDVVTLPVQVPVIAVLAVKDSH